MDEIFISLYTHYKTPSTSSSCIAWLRATDLDMSILSLRNHRPEARQGTIGISTPLDVSNCTHSLESYLCTRTCIPYILLLIVYFVAVINHENLNMKVRPIFTRACIKCV